MDKDLKDTIRKLEEAKKKQERLEKTIIILSGLLIIIVFTVIGINLYSGKDEKVSEPEINIVNEKTPEVIKKEEKIAQGTQKAAVSTKLIQPAENTAKNQVKEKKETNIQIQKTKEKITVTNQTKKEDKKQGKVVIVKKPEKVEKKPAKTYKGEIKPAKKEEKKKVVKKEEKKVEKATVQKGYYYIQVGAFSSKQNAEKAKKKYKISSSRFVIVKSGSLYKLLIGKFKTRKEAQNFMRKYGIKGIIKKI